MQVRTPQPVRLLALLRRFGFTVTGVDAHGLSVEGSTVEDIASVARFFGVPLQHLGEVERTRDGAARR